MTTDFDALREPARLAALHEADLLDTLPEESFDRLARLAARLLNAPLGQVNLVDDRRQFSKSSIAPPEWTGGRNTPLEDSFCKYTITTREPLVVEDARVHPLVAESGAVTEHGLVSYAGMPLVTPEGHAVGTLCVGDFRARGWTEGELEILRDLADSVTTEIELRREIGRHVRAREELAAQQRALSTLLSHMPGMAYRCRNEPGWPVEMMSRGVEEITGYTSEEFTSGEVLFGDLIHPEDSERVWNTVQEAVAARKPFRTEYRIRTREGLERWVWEQGEGVFSPGGDLIALEGFAKDVTDRKRAEEELARNEATLRAILRASPDVVELLDPEAKFRWVNPAVREVLGYAEHELASLSMLDLVHPDDRDGFAEAVASLGRGERDEVQMRYRAQHRTGDWVVLDARCRTIQDHGYHGVVVVARDVTQEEELQQRLRESEELYRQLFRTNPFPTWLVDLDTGDFLDVNDAAVMKYGFSREEFLAMSAADIRPPEELPSLQQALAASRTPGRFTRHTETRHRTRAGEILDVEVFSQAVSVQGRRLTIAIAHDVTERRKAEVALRESHDLVHSIVESTPDAIFVKNLEGHCLLVNSAGAGVLNRKPEEIVGKTDRELFPPETARAFREQDRKVAASGEMISCEETVSTPGGERVMVLTKVPRRDHEGRIVGVIGIGRDITQRKRAERTLEVMRAAIEASIDGIGIVSEDGVFTYVNQAQARLYGYNGPHDLIGKSWSILAEEAEVQRLQEEAMPAVTREGHWRGEAMARRRDGTTFPLDVSMTRIERVGLICVDRDVTDRKQAEQTMLAAKEEAERANRAKSDFLSRMSHELRTPLNAILGFAQLLEADATDPGDRESVEQILQAGRHLLGLINEVLDVARIEAGRVSLSLEPVAVREALRQALDLVRPLAAGHGVSLHTGEALSCRGYVRADLQRLKQVLLNFLSNAIKYNHPGGSVALSCDERAGRLRLSVSDTGPGIAQEKLERLFTPFERLGAEQGEVEGTGLGLALSKRLAQLMGGSVGVSSTPGQGSTFWVELPLAEAPAGRGELPAAPGDTQEAPPTHTVLLVEDNPANIRLLERILSRRPHVRLLPVMQGRRGLELAREQRPELILLDLNLPDVDGEEVLRELQADPELRDIPVVVVSADAMPAQVGRLLAAGASAYLTKPLDLKECLRVVDQLLNERGA